MILYVFDSLNIYINTDFYNHCKVISPGQQFLLDQLYTNTCKDDFAQFIRVYLGRTKLKSVNTLKYS